MYYVVDHTIVCITISNERMPGLVAICFCTYVRIVLQCTDTHRN